MRRTINHKGWTVYLRYNFLRRTETDDERESVHQSSVFQERYPVTQLVASNVSLGADISIKGDL